MTIDEAMKKLAAQVAEIHDEHLINQEIWLRDRGANDDEVDAELGWLRQMLAVQWEKELPKVRAAILRGGESLN